MPEAADSTATEVEEPTAQEGGDGSITAETGDPGSPASGTDGSTDDGKGNGWSRMLRAIREPELREGAGAVAGSGEGDTKPGDKQEDGKTPADSAEKPKADEAEKADASGDKSKLKEPAAGAKPRYAILGADGQPAGEVEWEDGTAVEFKVDGKTVKATSFDELVQMAQKGALVDRFQQRESINRDAMRGLEQRLGETSKVAEDTLMAVLFGTEHESAEEIQEKLRQELEPYRNPEFREGQDAKRRERARTEREQVEQREVIQKLNQGIWDVAREQYQGALGDYPYLDASDADEVMQRVYQRYTHRFGELVRTYEAEAKQHQVPVEQAHALAQREALAELSDESLRAAMQDLNDRYAAKAKAKAGAKPAASDDDDADDDELDYGPDLEAQAAQHNRRVEQKLEQRQRARTLKGGGAPPASDRGEPSLEGLPWHEKMAVMKRVLRGGR